MHVTVLSGRTGVTLKITADDTSNNLLTDGAVPTTLSADSRPDAGLIGAIITVETNPLRITFGTAALQAGTGHTMPVGLTFILESAFEVRNMQYINFTNAANAVIQVTPIYNLRGSAK